MIRQVVSFALGVAVGVSLYSLLRLRPLSPTRLWNSASRIDFHHAGNSLRAPWVQRSAPPQVFTPIRVHSEDHIRALIPETVRPRPRVRVPARKSPMARPFAATPEVVAKNRVEVPAGLNAPGQVGTSGAVTSAYKPAAASAPLVPETRLPQVPLNLASPSPAETATHAEPEAVAARVPPSPPTPKVFQTIGYVEKAGGQVEAIILQDNQVQVVHIGDLIAERYRVTRVSPESVAAVDEAQVKSPMSKPDVTASRELTAGVLPAPTVGDAARGSAGLASGPLGPIGGPISNPSAAGAQPDGLLARGTVNFSGTVQGEYPVANSLGYVEKGDGKVEAIMADGDSVRLVPTNPAALSVEGAPRRVAKGRLASLASAAPAPIPPTSLEEARWPTGDASKQAGEPAFVIRQASYELSNSAGMRAGIPAVGSPLNEASSKIANSETGLNVKPESAGAQSSGEARVDSNQASLTLKPLGFVVKADGEFAAIVSDQDQVYIVRKGDRFAGHYLALTVSAEAVTAVDEPPRISQPQPLDSKTTSPDLLTASAEQVYNPIIERNCTACGLGVSHELSSKLPEDPQLGAESPPPERVLEVDTQSLHMKEARQRSGPIRSTDRASKSGVAMLDAPTFIFQNLGYVQTHDGVIQAVVADGSQIYLVKQGDTFADQYRATSVDPLLVLAVRVAPQTVPGNFLSAQAEPGANTASNQRYGNMHFPMLGLVSVPAHSEVGASSGPVLGDLSVNLMNPFLTGFDPQVYYFTANIP